MTWATIQALIQFAPLVLKLLQSIENYAIEKQGEGKGRADAVAEALTIGAAQIDAAAKARAEADADHAAHPSDDGGFDGDFRRNG